MMTSLLRTPKGQSKVYVLGKCPYWRGHYGDVTFKSPLSYILECAFVNGSFEN